MLVRLGARENRDDYEVGRTRITTNPRIMGVIVKRSRKEAQ
jgi:hypothetical protein